jgi:hypothetical protein
MHAFADPVESEQHDADEAGFQEKGGHDLVGEERSDDVADFVGIAAPIGADLIRDHHAGHDTHGKAEREEVNPEAQQVAIDGAAGLQPEGVEKNDERRDADAVGRPEDVITDGQRKLDA